MLSVLIPVYNYSVERLLGRLNKSLIAAGIEFEILIYDDGSNADTKIWNRSSAKFVDRVRYKELNENIGRSKIRNLLAEEALYPNLLFMDCDGFVRNPAYIKNYLDANDGLSVLVGGTLYPGARVGITKKLHWMHGTEKEVQSVEERNKAPYYSFKSFHFFVPKAVFNQVKFDENIEGYGHEDTLFGLSLKDKGIPIKHIDNPLVHFGLEGNRDFMDKTEEAVLNLFNIEHEEIRKCVRLISFAERVRERRMVWAVKMVYLPFRTMIRNRLIKNGEPLWLLDFYKLGVFFTKKGGKRKEEEGGYY